MWYLFLVVGMIAFLGGIVLLWNGISSKGWRTTTGVIISSDMEKHSTSGPNRASSWRPQIVFEFTVDGERFEGKRLSYKVLGGSAPKCRDIVEGYPVGEETTVYYKPTDPKLSVLIPGVSLLSYFPLVFGAFFIVLSVLGIMGALD